MEKIRSNDAIANIDCIVNIKSIENMASVNRRDTGFTLIELVMAIAVLGIAMGVLSRGLQSVSTKAVMPIVSLQSSWIAKAYLDEITTRAQQGMPWCSNLNSDKRDRFVNRSQYRSLCDYQQVQPDLIYSFQGEALSALSDYRVKIVLSAVQQNALLHEGVIEGMHVEVTVMHPLINELTLESWVWSK